MAKPSDNQCEHPACSRWAVYGWGPPALPVEHWWCPLHTPAAFFDFLKTGRTPAQDEQQERIAA